MLLLRRFLTAQALLNRPLITHQQRRRSMDREISPPPAKRRRLSSFTPKKDAIAPLLPCESGDTIRVFSWNVNGITPFIPKTSQQSITSFFSRDAIAISRSTDTNENVSPPSLRAFLSRHSFPHILCLQEIKIAPGDSKTLMALEKAVNPAAIRTHDGVEHGDQGPSYQVFTTLPNDKFNARGPGRKGRLYGVASIIRGDMLLKYDIKVRKVDWDAEGRFSVIEISDKQVSSQDVVQQDVQIPSLVIFNTYAVNGTSNEYRDPRTGEVVGTRHDRKRAVHKLLAEECNALEEKYDCDIVITGDLNVAPATVDGHPNLRTAPHDHVISRADFHRRFLRVDAKECCFDGVDVWREMKGVHAKGYTYYPRNRVWGSSCDRVDLVVASRRLLKEKRVVACDIWNTEDERGPSDHVPISIEVMMRNETGSAESRDVGRTDNDRTTPCSGNNPSQ